MEFYLEGLIMPLVYKYYEQIPRLQTWSRLIEKRALIRRQIFRRIEVER